MSIKNISSSYTYISLREIAKEITVLYVEDDSLIRKEYFNFLSKFFTDITCKEDGEEAFKAVSKKKFDLIISDIKMPKVDGFEMVEKIRDIYPEQAIILISAHKDSDILYKSIFHGVDGYIFKPLNRDQTIDLLYKVVSNIKMQSENKRYKEHLEELVFSKTQEVVETFTIDKVTGLLSLAKLQQDIVTHPKYTIAFLKIRNFKNLNDFYGYDVGNDVLKQTADFLEEITDQYVKGSVYHLYRASGTHFAILTDKSSKELKKIVNDIVREYELKEIKIEDAGVLFEMDAGIVDNECEISLSNADKALRASEMQRKVVLYKQDNDLIAEHKSKLKCKDSIRRALNDDRFVPYYQPIVDNKTLKIQKYEALVRMITPEGEIVSPAMFLSVSKETKMYSHITRYMIRCALNDFKNSLCSVSINISLEDIQNLSTRKFIREQVKAFPEPSRIVFEILETEEISSYKDLQDFINEIKEFGCKVAIDDFGSGYSNFEHLVKLNVDYIKIDGSLISDIETNHASQTIVEMLSNFSNKMGIKTIAEFVSKKEINSLVRTIGVDESQGYLFSPPVPFNEAMNNISYFSYN